MIKHIKKYKYLYIAFAIIILIILWVTLVLDGDYGATLFFTIPSTITFLIGYSKTFNNTPVSTIKRGLKVFACIALAVALFCGLLIIIGLEGVFCVLMAYPFFILPMTVSYIIGLFIGNADKSIKRNSILFILFINPSTYIYDTYSEPIKQEVKTELIINASKEKIWEGLSTEIAFKNTPSILFQKGISYPKSIQIDTNSNIPTYLCITNNDTINLDIIDFTKDSLVTFIPRKQTIPMRELTPYDSINAKHLHNYFFVNHGQIRLEKINANKTKVVASTSYNYKIAPKWYWKLWSNYTINEMQLHVLNSISTQYEE